MAIAPLGLPSPKRVAKSITIGLAIAIFKAFKEPGSLFCCDGYLSLVNGVEPCFHLTERLEVQ